MVKSKHNSTKIQHKSKVEITKIGHKSRVIESLVTVQSDPGAELHEISLRGMVEFSEIPAGSAERTRITLYCGIAVNLDVIVETDHDPSLQHQTLTTR
jgi:hypothetical protein